MIVGMIVVGSGVVHERVKDGTACCCCCCLVGIGGCGGMGNGGNALGRVDPRIGDDDGCGNRGKSGRGADTGERGSIGRVPIMATFRSLFLFGERGCPAVKPDGGDVPDDGGEVEEEEPLEPEPLEVEEVLEANAIAGGGAFGNGGNGGGSSGFL